MAFPGPSEPRSFDLPLPDPEAYPGEPREYARALMQRKDDIEAEMENLRGVLASHNATASTSLFDPEGYPRGDLDIYAIRHARSALARLTTDRNEVTTRLATALEVAFTAEVSERPFQHTNPSSNGNKPNGHDSSLANLPAITSMTWPSHAVVRVNSVASGSPAAEAGLQKDDLIYDFAGHTEQSGGLQAIGILVGRSDRVPLRLLIQRSSERLTLVLTPRTGWGGRGSLGCYIVPV